MNSDPSIVQPVASRYTDCDTPFIMFIKLLFTKQIN
jgi:hypothetical protein